MRISKKDLPVLKNTNSQTLAIMLEELDSLLEALDNEQLNSLKNDLTSSKDDQSVILSRQVFYWVR